MFEKHSHSGENNSQRPTEVIDNGIYMEIVEGINKKWCIFGLGSQVVVKESLRPLPSISADVVFLEKVAAMKAKIEALTAELKKKILNKKR